MPLDPQLRPILDGIAAAWPTPVWQLEPAVARADAEKGLLKMAAATPEVELADVADKWIPGPGGVLPLRVYRPVDEPTGTVVFFHGGGGVLGSVASYDPQCRLLAHRSGATVVSVEYRLAPEHPFPCAVNDAYVALCWVARELERERLAVAGDSAGGNLAAVCALKAREEGFPSLRHQVLLYPSIDARGGYPSRAANGTGFGLDTAAIAWFAQQYLPDGIDATDWRISPICAPSHADLPPALVVTAELDPLRDEGEAYAAALPDADLHRYDGMIHGFWQFQGILDAADAAMDECAKVLRDALR